MDQVNQGNNNDAPPNMPVKRKRGRPRKDKSINRREGAQVPPGFGRVNGNQPRQVEAIEDANVGIVGQAVTGVVEAAFDAGYLLNVKIGNSNTSLRGVVFKPGHFVPISAQNDVAPHVHMIRRNDIFLPVHGHHPRSKERNEQLGNLRGIETGHLLNGSPPANQVHRLAPQTADLAASKGKHVSPVSAHAVPSVGSRGTVVPVVLQPISISNGLPPVNQLLPSVPSRSGHTESSKHKQVQTVTSQPQASHQVTPKGVQNDNGPLNQGTVEVLYGEEVKLMNTTGVSTPDEVNKRVQFSAQSSETHVEKSMAADKSSVEDSGVSMEGDSDDMNEPLVVEPLQAIHSGPVPKPYENHRIGRMSELLQALQENMTEPGALS